MDKKVKSKLTGKLTKQGSNRTGVKSKPGTKKTGPKPKKINWKDVTELAKIYCTQEEIAAFVGTSPDYLATRFMKEVDPEQTLGEWMNFQRGAGRASLRRKQYQHATGPDPSTPMLIWLGKQWLGQAEKADERPTIDAKTVNVIELTEATLNTWIQSAK